MKELTKILIEAQEQGKYFPKLALFVKLDGGGTQSTGSHKVRLMSCKIVKGKSFKSKGERYEAQLLVEENSVQKTYNFPIKDEVTGNIHYLVERLAPIPEGTEIILEGKRSATGSYIDVKVVGKGGKLEEPEDPDHIDYGDIPIIEDLDEGTTPTLKEGETEI